MIKSLGIEFNALGEGQFDDPLGFSTGAGLIFGTTGGVMEAALRTVCDILNGTSSDAIDYVQVRGIEDGIKIAEVEILDLKIRAAVAHGLGNARKLIERVKAGEKFDFIEIMACPGGCINGGGQPLQVSDVRNWINFKEKEPRHFITATVKNSCARLTTILQLRNCTKNTWDLPAACGHISFCIRSMLTGAMFNRPHGLTI